MNQPLEKEKVLNSLDSIAKSLNRIADALELANKLSSGDEQSQTPSLDNESPDCKDLISKGKYVKGISFNLPPHKKQKS